MENKSFSETIQNCYYVAEPAQDYNL